MCFLAEGQRLDERVSFSSYKQGRFPLIFSKWARKGREGGKGRVEGGMGETARQWQISHISDFLQVWDLLYRHFKEHSLISLSVIY